MAIRAMRSSLEHDDAGVPEPDDRVFRLLRTYCQGAVIAVVGLSCLVLLGWVFHVRFLMSVVPGLVTMKVNTALGLAVAAISLGLLLPGQCRGWRGRAARLLASAVMLLGVLSLSQYLFAVNLGIDEWLIRDPEGSVGTSAPGRMAPMTAIAFVAIGAALLSLDWKPRRGGRPAQVLSLLAGLIALMALCGYAYHAVALTRLLMYTQVAVHTAVALFLLSGAIFFARPRAGMAEDLTGAGTGSVMARRFLPAVFFFPLVLGWIQLRGQYAGLYGTELGLALYATANVIVFALLVWLSARRMNVEYAQRSRAEIAIRELNAELEERVAVRTRSLEDQAGVLSEQAALLELAQDAIIVRDMAGRIVFWNRGAEAMYGWDRSEAVGKLKSELVRPESPEMLAGVEDDLLKQGRWEGESVQRKRDGSQMNVASRWALQRDAEGAPRRILTINNDITIRREMESQLRQSQKLEAVGQLAAGLSHEFNNLLQALLSMATVVRLRAGTGVMAEIGQAMEVQIKHGASLTQQLLLFSQGQAIERSHLDLLEQVQQAGVLLLRLLPENIRVAVETSFEPLPVEGDPGQMQQVLLNLAINARDAMPAGGSLTLRTGFCEGGVFVEVEDTGHGIDEATRARIFEPFFTTKDLGKGSGLGLAVVHGIVEQHGGRVEVRSSPGRGSTFRVVLPTTSREALPAEPGLENEELLEGRGAVLLVEDEEGVRNGITMLLEMIGYEVTAVGSGEEAMALQPETAPDLLLSDVNLPGMNGSALAERLCERWPALKVVLMSGYFDDEALLANAGKRGWDFLPKPFEMTDLSRHLRAAMEGKMADRAGRTPHTRESKRTEVA